jgi:hypothetical protein
MDIAISFRNGEDLNSLILLPRPTINAGKSNLRFVLSFCFFKTESTHFRLYTLHVLTIYERDKYK